jgi:hypothetical protein
LAFDFRGFDKSTAPGDSHMFTVPLQLDVPLAVRYIRRNGAKTVAVLGAISVVRNSGRACPKRACRPHSESR